MTLQQPPVVDRRRRHTRVRFDDCNGLTVAAIRESGSTIAMTGPPLYESGSTIAMTGPPP